MALGAYQKEVNTPEAPVKSELQPIGNLLPGKHYCRIDNVVVDTDNKAVIVLFSELSGAGWFEETIPLSDNKRPFPAMFLFVSALFDKVPIATRLYDMFKDDPESAAEALTGLGVGLTTALTNGSLLCTHTLGTVALFNSRHELLQVFDTPMAAHAEAKARDVELARTTILEYSCQYGAENEAKVAGKTAS